jgi:hypothetical protein
MMLAAVAMGAAIASAGTASAQAPTDPEDVVVLSGTALIEPDETVSNVVVFHGSAVIEGTVQENVVAFDAPVTISGTVEGDVVVFRGLLRVEDGAVIEGDVFASTRVIAEGATVRGDVHGSRAFGLRFGSRFGLIAGLAIWLAVMVSTLLLGLAAVWLAPRGIDATVAASRTGTGAAIGWGLLLFFGLPATAVIAIVTLVGIPFGVGLLLALALIYATGHTASAWLLGRVILREPAGRALAFLVGWAILSVVTLVPFLGGLVWFAATVFGLGTIAVAVWRARRAAPSAAGAVPPAMPPAPA